MIILGLTGSIGMGKTTAANVFRYLHIPVYDADQIVHNLMGRGGEAVEEVLKTFPEADINGYVNRHALGSIVLANKSKLRKLEKILHPYVRKKQLCFLKTTARRRTPLVVLDIPLLFETGGEVYCDGIIVVSALPLIQKNRVLKRSGMDADRFRMIVDSQIKNSQKCQMADFILHTGLGRSYCMRKINKIILKTKLWKSRSWSPTYTKMIDLN